MDGHHPIHQGPKWSKKTKEGQILLLLELRCPSFPALRYQSSWFLDLQIPWLISAVPLFSGLWTCNELYHQLSWFSSLHMARLWGLAPITSWISYLYLYWCLCLCQCLCLCLCNISCWFCFSRESWYNSGALRYAGGEGNGTPLQYSCLEDPMDGGAW